MGLRKGQTNNPAGRPPGAKNRVTKKLRLEITAFLEEQFITLKKDMKKLEPKDRAQLYTKLLPFAVPQLKAVEHSGEIRSSFEDMTDEELDIMLQDALARAEKVQLLQEFEEKLKSIEGDGTN